MRRKAQSPRIVPLAWAALLMLAAFYSSGSARAVPGAQRVFLPALQNGGSPLSAVESQALERINIERRAAGCPPVQLNQALITAADAHSQDMGSHNFFSHTGSDGSNFSQRARRAQYQYRPSGEVIAAGYDSGLSVVDGWMRSSGHRAIILTCANTDIGIGMVAAPGSQWGIYWTGVFGQR